MVGVGGAHQHALRLDATHFNRLEVAHENAHQALHFLQGDVWHEAADNRAQMTLT